MVLGSTVIILKTSMGFENFLSNKLSKGDFYCLHVSVSQVLGFGLMDAEALVIRAKTWVSVPEQISCSTSEFYVAQYVWFSLLNCRVNL